MKTYIIVMNIILMNCLIFQGTNCKTRQIKLLNYLRSFSNMFSKRIAENISVPMEEIRREKEYDFIVIGGGTAGSVVANRLTENKNWKVLVLEAGGYESFITDMPISAEYLPQTEFNWGYSTVPQDNACWAMKDKKCPWPRGKVLGGSSVINYMIYSRGSRNDYDSWADQGNPGWSFDEVLPYFLKSENMQIPELKSSKYHSSGGYLDVESVPYRTPLAQAFLDGAEELGYSLGDYNVEDQHGFSFLQATLRKGSRCSASKAFINPVKNRTNLHISLNSTVAKIIIDPNTKEATGVEFIRDDVTYRINARKEVILSAGSLNSPQILMLSGIGPKEHLLELGIPLLNNLKVGQNLQDHATFYGLTFLLNDTSGFNITRLSSLSAVTDYFVKGNGPYTLPGGVEALGYLRTMYAQDKRPDIEFLFIADSLSNDPTDIIKTSLNFRPEFYEKLFNPIANVSSWTIVPVLLLPKSRGSVTLKDDNPLSQPIFDANYYSHVQDLATIVEGIKIAIRFADTLGFKLHGSKLYDTSFPGCEEFDFGSDEYWVCALKFLSYTLYHQTSTCKMGPATDPGAVVDAELKVYGIKHLRVVDASIIPTIPTAHIVAVAYMIGEKASDLIKESWQSNVQQLSYSIWPVYYMSWTWLVSL